MYPQFLIMLDEKEEEKEVTVRVGQAVNTVGLAGTRTTISGVSTRRIVAEKPSKHTNEIAVPDTSDAGAHRNGRARRAGHKRVLPLPERAGGSCHCEEVSARF